MPISSERAIGDAGEFAPAKREGTLSCSWSLGRGFNAAAGVWRLGIVGFSELGSTAVLG